MCSSKEHAQMCAEQYRVMCASDVELLERIRPALMAHAVRNGAYWWRLLDRIDERILEVEFLAQDVARRMEQTDGQ